MPSGSPVPGSPVLSGSSSIASKPETPVPGMGLSNPKTLFAKLLSNFLGIS